jgi:hypothetical protein
MRSWRLLIFYFFIRFVFSSNIGEDIGISKGESNIPFQSFKIAIHRFQKLFQTFLPLETISYSYIRTLSKKFLRPTFLFPFGSFQLKIQKHSTKQINGELYSSSYYPSAFFIMQVIFHANSSEIPFRKAQFIDYSGFY